MNKQNKNKKLEQKKSSDLDVFKIHSDLMLTERQSSV